MDSLNETYGKMNAKKMTWKDWERQGSDAWESREKRKDNPYKKKGQDRTSWFDGWDNKQKDSDDGDFDESYGKMNASKVSSKEKSKNRALSKADRDAQPKGKVSLKPMPASLAKKMKEDFVNQMNIIVEGEEIESSIEESMNPAQLEKLKAGYESLRGKKISAENGMKISKTLEKLDKKSLINLLNADIPFVSTLAVNKLMMNHDMSGADINKVRTESMDIKFRGESISAEDAETLLAAGVTEEISGSGYELYHKTLGSAIDTAITHAKLKFGIDITDDERMDQVGMGPRKPSNGKTNTYRLMGNKGKAIQVQVFNRGGPRPYELNMYKE